MPPVGRWGSGDSARSASQESTASVSVRCFLAAAALALPPAAPAFCFFALFFFEKSFMAENVSALSMREPNPIVGKSMPSACAKLVLAFARLSEPRVYERLVNDDSAVSAQRFLARWHTRRSRSRLWVRDDVNTLQDSPGGRDEGRRGRGIEDPTTRCETTE